MHCTSLHYTALHYTALHCTEQHHTPVRPLSPDSSLGWTARTAGSMELAGNITGKQDGNISGKQDGNISGKQDGNISEKEISQTKSIELFL